MDELEKQIRTMVTEQARQGEQIKTLFNSVGELKQLAESVHEIALGVRDLTRAQQSMGEKVGKLSADVDEIKSKPAKRWDSIVAYVITAVIGAVVGYISTKIGLK